MIKITPCLECRLPRLSFFIAMAIFTFSYVNVDLAEETAAPALEEPPIEEADRDYWAYQSVIRPDVPENRDDRWSKNSIDKFILSKLKEKQLKPVEPANRLSLLRRVTFNLTGLPPTLEEVDSFLKDDSEAAFEHVIERLINSSTYGERWAQHWLDLVRFAETDGFEHDKTRPEAWRYRDWVINAFNADLPYDEFLKLQIAGDEIAPDSHEALVATGYLLAGPDMPDINSQVERKHNFLNAMTANVGEVVLGLRFGCAQCHHHRTDPISQYDFYRLRAFFETIDLFKNQPIQLEGSQKTVNSRVTKNLEKTIPVSHLWIRGDFNRPGPEVNPQFPRVIDNNSEQASPSIRDDHRRTDLVNWLTQREHPLTARVMVNRIWQHHFGVGLISTPSDYGWMGDPASHSELLDWLAAEFMESGWSIQHMHRLILNSATYQLASFPAEALSSQQIQNWEALQTIDPSNRLLGRFNRRRLEAEAIRDSILAVSGSLNKKAGGPGVRPPLPEAVASTLLKNQWQVTKDKKEHTCRSIYLFARRNLRMPLLESFDKPDQNLSCPQRSQTTIAPQALHLLNSEFVRDQAVAFAATVIESSNDQQEQINFAYQTALGRPATETEHRYCQKFLSEGKDIETSWIDICHGLYNLNEFIYLD